MDTTRLSEELLRLGEEFRAGKLTPEEYHEAKKRLLLAPENARLLEPPPPARAPRLEEPRAAQAVLEPPPLTAAAPPRLQYHRFTFTGSAGEFFRIWVVNLFLSVVTLGIYYAWAKVRARQYFYSHTFLAGHPFEYLAEPVHVLKGHLIVGGGLLAYYLLQYFAPEASLLLMALGFVLLPWLLHQSLRFTAYNSAYRNIRFRFHGTLGQSYLSYFLLPLLTPFTLGLLVPYVRLRQRQYVFGNAALGATRAQFGGEVGAFYATYVVAALMGLGVYALFAVVLFASGGLAVLGGDFGPLVTGSVFGGLFLGYLVLVLGMLAVQQHIYASLANHTWQKTTLGKLRFVSNLRTRDLVWLSVSNFLAIVFTLGLAIPWAKVRYTKHVLDHLAVVSYGDLEEFTAAAGRVREGSVGEAAADFFNIDVGL